MTRRERLTQRRKALGLTQEDLAALLKVERSTVRRWESGETAPAAWLRPKLARTLKVSAERLVDLLDNGTASPGPCDPVSAAGKALPRQLPPAMADFTGRAAELEALTRMLNKAGSGRPGTLVISAIGGTPGVGKTALALHWAHRVADRFPDGQLHVNLRGFDPSGTPATPEEAIRGFLDALGVPPHRLPPAPEAQAGLYRTLLADRSMLIMLDNARDEQQVRPLLPASPGSLIVVTSRNQLAGLVSAEGARLLSLDVLTHSEAVQLVTARLGAERAAAEPRAVAEIATLCACLPLALAVAVARAASQRRLSLSAVAAELRDAPRLLDALDTGDPAASVRTVFSWSYQWLSPDVARMFRLLGLHPGPEISVLSAASLAAVDGPTARRALTVLSRACLLTEHAAGRFAFHDLLRAYAADQARDADSQADRQAATGRLLDHYLHTADRAWGLVQPSREPTALAPARPGVTPEPLADARQAMDWFEAEQHVLVPVVTLADRSGFDQHAWRLPVAMHQFLILRGHRKRILGTLRTALDASTRLGDMTGQAIVSRLLGSTYTALGDLGQALTHAADSLVWHRGSGTGSARRRHTTRSPTLPSARVATPTRSATRGGHFACTGRSATKPERPRCSTRRAGSTRCAAASSRAVRSADRRSSSAPSTNTTPPSTKVPALSGTLWAISNVISATSPKLWRVTSGRSESSRASVSVPGPRGPSSAWVRYGTRPANWCRPNRPGRRHWKYWRTWTCLVSARFVPSSQLCDEGRRGGQPRVSCYPEALPA